MGTGLATLHGFGTYRLFNVLGEGEVCTVYRAVRDPDGAASAAVALAIVHPVGAADAEAADAFVERAEAALGFRHTHVAAVLEAGKLEGRAYSVREWVDGLSLAELLPKRGKGLKAADAYAVMTAVLESLKAAHAFSPGLAHGRLDAGAVLVDSDGCVRVSGFGQADAHAATDLLAVARLAQSICAGWPPEVDAWIDRVADEFATPDEAQAALAAIAIEGTKSASKGLARRVKRRLTAQSTASESDDEHGPQQAPLELHQGRSGEDRRQITDRRKGSRRNSEPNPEVKEATQEARWVAVVCGAAVLAALVIEITRHIA